MSITTWNPTLAATLIFVSAWVVGCGSSDDASAPSDMFSKTIKPILKKHCFECHEGFMSEAGLKLDSIEDIRKGGRNGAGIIPGDPGKGTIMMSILPSETGPATMPPYTKLSADEIESIREWIRQGAN